MHNLFQRCVESHFTQTIKSLCSVVRMSPVSSNRSDECGYEAKFCASRGHWRLQEDCRLRELVAIHGPQNWNLIAAEMQGRSGKLSLNYTKQTWWTI